MTFLMLYWTKWFVSYPFVGKKSILVVKARPIVYDIIFQVMRSSLGQHDFQYGNLFKLVGENLQVTTNLPMTAEKFHSFQVTLLAGKAYLLSLNHGYSSVWCSFLIAYVLVMHEKMAEILGVIYLDKNEIEKLVQISFFTANNNGFAVWILWYLVSFSSTDKGKEPLLTIVSASGEVDFCSNKMKSMNANLAGTFPKCGVGDTISLTVHYPRETYVYKVIWYDKKTNDLFLILQRIMCPEIHTEFSKLSLYKPISLIPINPNFDYPTGNLILRLESFIIYYPLLFEHLECLNSKNLSLAVFGDPFVEQSATYTGTCL